MAADQGRARPRHDLTRVVYLRVPVEVAERLHLEAGARMSSVNQVAVDLIRKGLRKRKRRAKK